MHRGPLEIERADGAARWWIVADRWSLVYGDGPTLRAALYDYLISLRDWWQLRRADRRRQP